MSTNSFLVCCTFCFAIVVIVGVGLFAASFKVINFNEVGLKKNKFSVKMESDKIYFSGRHFVGIAGTFVMYPTTWQSLEFTNASNSDSGIISAKTSESTTIELEISMMFRYRPEFMYDLYSKYPKGNQKKDMVNTAKESIQKDVNLYKLADFFANRETVEASLAYNISVHFRSIYSAEITMFVINQIVIDESFEQQYIEAAVLTQEALTSDEMEQLQFIEGNFTSANSNYSIAVQNKILAARLNSIGYTAQKIADADALTLQSQLNASVTLATIFTDTTTPNFTNMQRFMLLDQTLTLPNSTLYIGYTNNTIDFQIKT